MLEQGGDQRGLAQWFDDLLFRMEMWRPTRPQAAAAALAGLGLAALGLGWSYGIRTDDGPVEDRIPHATIDRLVDDRSDLDSSDGGGGPQPDTAEVDGLGGDGPVTLAVADQPEQSDEPSGDEVILVIHVTGEVLRPGLVTVDSGARVNDVVMAAGGPTTTADLHRLNLAAPVADGMQVRVPAVGDEETGPLVVMPAQNADVLSGEQTIPPGPVNLNTATAELLDTLPGVGPATASAILTWREENGGFHALEDLLAVPGIGRAKLAALRELVTL